MSILWCCPTHVMYFKTFFYNGKKKISINFEFLVCVDLAVDWEKGELVVNFHRLKQLITNKMNLTHLYFVHQWDHKYTLKAWKTLIPSLLFLLFELLSWLISEKKCLIILFNTNYIVFQQLQCYGYHYLKTNTNLLFEVICCIHQPACLSFLPQRKKCKYRYMNTNRTIIVP